MAVGFPAVRSSLNRCGAWTYDAVMNVLATGGAGYIGSHAVLRLLRDGHRVVVVDNLFRGHRAAIDAIAKAAGEGAKGRFSFVQGEISDSTLVRKAMSDHAVDTVMHFAALTYVGESVNQPLQYYRTNTAGALSLIESAEACGVQRFVFSSTAATYGEPPADKVPIQETLAPAPINPYGASKLMVERLLSDFNASQKAAGKPFAYACLRYFNVAGCDRSGALGEHHEPETHLVPIVLQCLLGLRPQAENTLSIFGDDYPTPDGTCVRDYVHVEDLVDAHVTVMNALKPGDGRIYNLGIGNGLSVKQIVQSVERVTGMKVKTKIGPRRAGDPATLYADPGKIAREIGWKAKITNVDEIVASAWAWFKANPKGYAK